MRLNRLHCFKTFFGKLYIIITRAIFTNLLTSHSLKLVLVVSAHTQKLRLPKNLCVIRICIGLSSSCYSCSYLAGNLQVNQSNPLSYLNRSPFVQNSRIPDSKHGIFSYYHNIDTIRGRKQGLCPW